LKYTDDQRLKLVSFNPPQIGHPGRELADLGPAIPVNNQVRGVLPGRMGVPPRKSFGSR
jgi:hypothetical protein